MFNSVAPRAGGGWEWPTLALAGLIYGGWLALTWFWTDLPWYLAVPPGAWLLAWQGSLQHEIIHGHPTPHAALNRAIATPPLALWLPFEVYRRAHLQHHVEPWLTDPVEDPESAYLTWQVWNRTGAVGRALRRLNLTLFGRLTLGPFLNLWAVYGNEVARLRRGDRSRIGIWLRHALAVAAVLTWVVAVCGVPLWAYALGCVIPSIALTRLRAFAEHRFADAPEHRTAIVESSRVFGLLFLNNNLHVVHHRWPNIPWYRLPGLYAAQRDRFIERNGGLVYHGYREVARRFLFRPHDTPVHPQHAG